METMKEGRMKDSRLDDLSNNLKMMEAMKEQTKQDTFLEDLSNNHTESSKKSTEDVNNNHEKDQRDAIIQKEERMVRRAKILVSFAIVACAALVSTSVYFFAKQSDEHNFEIEVSIW